MKVIQITKSLGLLILFIIMFSACQKENIKEEQLNEANTISINGIQQKEGILIFESKDRFDQYFKEAYLNQNSLSEFRNQFPRVQNMFDAYQDFINSDYEEVEIRPLDEVVRINDMAVLRKTIDGYTTDAVVADEITQSILNSKALLGIGDILYKFSYNTLYEIPQSHSDLKNASIQDLQASDQVIKHQIQRKIIDINSLPQYKIEQECDREYTLNGTRKRVVGELIERRIFLNSSAILKVKHERRRSNGRWRSETAFRMELQGAGVTVCGTAPSRPFDLPTQRRSNSNGFSTVVAVGAFCTHRFIQANCTFRAVLNSNEQVVFCSINF